ncbi:cyclin-like protein [Trichoderma citrinoviride]|uniref:Cyclin-like protein n=1 Tax=Trichoderma citrinoviride TaxID=58853 RepID=A0A2T4B1V6_9HYPO|nr:cyclin-like protein [Trichoderma citrinoviride]PTB63315.1 cyclin-like protein [Trichoderma citrinoviride]
MTTEDERYRQSSQFRLWSFSPTSLRELRVKTNDLAKQQISPRFAADAQPEFLTPAEETMLVQFFTTELIRAAQFCELPTEIRSTAAVFFRRFYITNSVMTYPPTELLKTSLFFGCKAEGYYIRLAKLAEMFPNTTSEQILAGEFLLCQGIRFAFDVRHPFRALEGAILELRRQLPEQEGRVAKAHALAREILKFSPLLTDAYFHYTPSQIMMAALLMVDKELVDILIPAAQPGDEDSQHVSSHAEMRDKIIKTIESCRDMLEKEPPQRMKEYWETPELVKSLKPLRKKLQKCRDTDRADLVALQRARREQATTKVKKPTPPSDGAVFGDAVEARDPKRRKLEAANDLFGPAL